MKTRYRNVAFLVELLVNILVFSISCAVLVGLFGKAQEISHTTRRQTQAHAVAQSLLNVAKAGDMDSLSAEKTEEGTWLLGYDENWNRTGASASYVVRLNLREEERPGGVLRHFEVSAETAGGAELAFMETSSYSPAKGGPAS